MSEQKPERVRISIVIPEENEEFQVEGFAEAYEAFLCEDPSRRVQRDYFAYSIILVGSIMTMVGAWNLLVGPASSALGYKALSSVGALVSIVGAKIASDSAGVSPEAYLATEYDLFDNEGALNRGFSPVEYLGESKFRVKY